MVRRLPIGVDRYTYYRISSAGTINVASDPVILHTIIMNPTSGTLTVCDGTAAAAATVAVLAPGTNQGLTARFDTELGSGLKLIASTNMDVTVSYTSV